MYRVFVEFATVDFNAIREMITPKFLSAARAGAQVAKDAHQAIVDSWSNQPEIRLDNMVTDVNSVSIDVVVEDTGSSWWEAVNFGSTSPGTEGVWMTIGPYSARSAPGAPISGDGSKSYDGVIRSRGPSVIEPRDFIGYVVDNYTDDIVDAITQALQ